MCPRWHINVTGSGGILTRIFGVETAVSYCCDQCFLQRELASTRRLGRVSYRCRLHMRVASQNTTWDLCRYYLYSQRLNLECRIDDWSQFSVWILIVVSATGQKLTQTVGLRSL